MKRENLLNTLGFCLLIACFMVALVRVVGHRGGRERPGEAVVRLAHWQLESGLRDAFDQLAREYEAQHPGVRIEQIPIPERTYASWTKTQLIGGTAPDIIQLGYGVENEELSRFFLPFSDYVRQPNPYNAGTNLADLPWRDTFIDGLVAAPNYRFELLEHYGVSISMFTVRVYYNRDLWRIVLGDTPAPRDYDEFMDACRRVHEYNERTGRSLLPIAGSKANGPMLVYSLFASQTQNLIQDPRIAGPTLRTHGLDVGLAYLAGAWSLHTPAIQDGLHLMREVGGQMQPGFMQLGREDAAFYFVQGNALMITTGSWDSPSFRAQASFDIGVFPLPLPTPDHPRFGRNLKGPNSESEVGTSLGFGITRLSKNPDVALDFLRYLTSQRTNARFSELSGWLPAIVDVVPPDSIKPFLPVKNGYVYGFDLNLSLAPNVPRIMGNAFNNLVSRVGSIERFIAEVEPDLPTAIIDDIRLSQRGALTQLARQDIALAAYLGLLARAPANEELRTRVDAILEAQTATEASRLWYLSEADRHAAARR